MTIQRTPASERRITTTDTTAGRGVVKGDWRATLRSPRWNVAKLDNPEMNPARRPVSVAFWLALGAITFAVLLAGYGSGFWR